MQISNNFHGTDKVIKVLVADDCPVVDLGIKQILSPCEDIHITGNASCSYPEVIRQLREEDHDVLLLDISMLGFKGLDIIAQIKEEFPCLAILVLSFFPEKQYALRAMKKSASGYLAKQCSTEELIRAIRKISTGGKYVSSYLAEVLAFGISAEGVKSPHERLSEREYQIMTLIGQGKTVKDVANLLSLSIKTINTHRSRLLKKMELRNNAEIVYYAVKEGLI